jgi:hypothetical protein
MKAFSLALALVLLLKYMGSHAPSKEGAITRAHKAGVKQLNVEFMGRWRAVEWPLVESPGSVNNM